MKRLSLVQPTIILMVGVPGAGKSFFARQFADSYDLPCISADRIKFELFNEPQHNTNEQQIVHRVADYMVDELLKSRGSFIVDGLLGNVKTQRMSIERRAREQGYAVLAVWVQVDTTTAKDRSIKRNPKKRDDQFNTPLTEAAFTAWSKQLTGPTLESHVVVSGKHTFATQRTAVLRKLQPAVSQPELPEPASRPHQTQPAESSKPAAETTHQLGKVATPTPTRRMSHPAPRPENRRITIS